MGVLNLIRDESASGLASRRESEAYSTGVRQLPAELLQRITLIESRLAELSGSTVYSPDHSSWRSPSVDPASSEQRISLSHAIATGTHPFLTAPPSVLSSVVDTYFVHVHDQPYSYFQEASFRQKFRSNLLPRCLILVVLASAVRFSTHEFYAGKTLAASEIYAREAWLAVLADDLTAEDSINLHVVQAVNMLAVVDFTAGRVNSGWLKIGLAARISQVLHLMREPESGLPSAEQEERRRTFWSVYLLDKLISCGRSRPQIILDQDCQVQLPCDEQMFTTGQGVTTQTLHQLLSWDTEDAENPSPFALVVLLASNFGRCTRYVHGPHHTEEMPPWDTRSEFSGINSSLLLFESYAKIGSRSVMDMIVRDNQSNTVIHRQEFGHHIFAHALFHLCHCLLNHPFLMHLRLKPFGGKVPRSFASRALQTGVDHATLLVDLLRDAAEAGCLVESSFYAYSLAIAGGIHSIASHVQHPSVAHGLPAGVPHFQHSLDALERLATFWVHAANMSVRLREFHTQSHRLVGLLHPVSLTDDLDPASEEVLWSMIDYAVLAVDPRKGVVRMSESAVPSLSSPSSWALETDLLTLAPSRVDGSHEDLFSGLTPTVRLNEVENFLNCNPQRNGMI
ncbi:hypothetical protein BBP40_005627 [Aspergillus hancockii]|nr:hypothetical protein BBP40_005627 [Aspergillus hancockii]